MPTRRIGDLPPDMVVPIPPPTCTNPDHSPPTMQVFGPGVYEHTCPACGHVIRFQISNIGFTMSCS